MSSVMNPGFEPPIPPEVVASLVRKRKADRSIWTIIRGARRAAWRALSEREDPTARAFVNAIDPHLSKASVTERIRGCRIAALGRAIRARSPSVRLMELATYQAFAKLSKSREAS